ncbi:MAG TPA: hypothetical protein VGH19_06915 [Verrucomicrobiae bacterium]
MKTTESKVILTAAHLRSLTIDLLTAEAGKAADIEKDSKTATERHKSAFPETGKLLAVIGEKLEEMKLKQAVARNTSLSAYWEFLTKSKPNPHALSCSVAFDCFVKGGLITEADYDLCSAQCLEIAASITNKVGGDLTHKAIAEAANHLHLRGHTAAKKLKEILEGLKGPKKMDEAKAIELIQEVLAHGHHTALLAVVTAEMTYIKDEDKAKEFHIGLKDAADAIENNMTEGDKPERRFDDDKITSWYHALHTPQVQVLTAKT